MNIVWQVRLVLAGLAITSSLSAFVVVPMLEDPVLAGGATALVAVLLTFVCSALLLAMILRPLEALHKVIDQTYADGDLTRRASVSGSGEIAAVAEAYNKLIGSFQTIIGKVFFNSVEVGRAAKQLMDESNRVATGSVQQYNAAQATTLAMTQLTENMNQVSQHAHETAHISQSASDLSYEGVTIANNASAEMQKIANSVTASSAVIRALGERSRAISGIVQTIREIADQTNLLALNAAIEAARAGEQGRGFAVVADEVRKLAERTSLATGEISSMIGAIQGETQSAIASIEAGTDQARSGAAMAHQAAESLERINSGARDTMEKVDAIAKAIEEQSMTGQSIASHVHSIMEMSQGNSAAAEQTQQEAGQLDYLATNLQEIGNVFRLGPAGEQAVSTHAKMPALVQQAAREVSALLEKSLDAGRLKLEDLFDDRYQPIAGTQPQKFKTKFDSLFDQVMPMVQEGMVERNPWLVYAICCDRRGYVPTHNKRFSEPLTGKYDYDFVHNRTKRIFDDPVGKRCGSHEQPFLLQTYRRDTGEIMHDISAPVYVRNQHWGGFRIGYRTEV
jgi:methyl-accepting chemotaxis protein